jgi:hypothetical protein
VCHSPTLAALEQHRFLKPRRICHGMIVLPHRDSLAGR